MGMYGRIVLVTIAIRCTTYALAITAIRFSMLRARRRLYVVSPCTPMAQYLQITDYGKQKFRRYVKSVGITT